MIIKNNEMMFELDLDGQKILIEGTDETRLLIKKKNELERSIDDLTFRMSISEPKTYKDIEKLNETTGKKIDDAFREFVITINKLRDIAYDN